MPKAPKFKKRRWFHNNMAVLAVIVLLMAGLMGATFAYFDQQQRAQSRDRQQVLSDTLATTHMRLVNGVISQLKRRLESVADSEAAEQILERRRAESDVIERYVANLKSALPEAIILRFVPTEGPKHRISEEDQNRSTNLIELDLLRQARDAKDTVVETYQVELEGKKTWVFSLARWVEPGAIYLVSVSREHLEHVLSLASQQRDTIRIVKKVGDREFSVTTVRGSNPSPVESVARVPGTKLQLKTRMPVEALEPMVDPVPWWAIFLAGTAAPALLSLLLLYFLLTRRVRADVTSLKTSRAPWFHYRAFEELLEKFAELTKAAHASSDAREEAVEEVNRDELPPLHGTVESIIDTELPEELLNDLALDEESASAASSEPGNDRSENVADTAADTSDSASPEDNADGNADAPKDRL